MEQLKELCKAGNAVAADSYVVGRAENPEQPRGGFRALLEQLKDTSGAPGKAVADLADEMAVWLLGSGPTVFDDAFGRLGRGRGKSVAYSKAPHPIELWAEVVCRRAT